MGLEGQGAGSLAGIGYAKWESQNWKVPHLLLDMPLHSRPEVLFVSTEKWYPLILSILTLASCNTTLMLLPQVSYPGNSYPFAPVASIFTL